jgi:chromosome segregation ATPase
MTAYPDPAPGYPQPPTPMGTIYPTSPTYPSNHAGSDHDSQEIAAPQLPPRWWQWGFIVAGLVALGLQGFALTRVIDSTSQQTKFAAQVAEWEKTNEERKKAFDSWTSLQTELSDQVEQLRKESSKQKAENELLANNGNQALRDVEFAQGNLGQLKELLKKEQEERVLLQSTTAQLKADRDSLAKEKERLTNEVSALNQKNTAEIAKLAAAQESTASQEQLVETSRKRFESLEKQLAQLDELLSSRAETSAKFQLEKEKVAGLQAEQQRLQTSLDSTKLAKDKLTKEIEDSTRQLTVLRTTMKDSQTEVSRSADEAARLEAQIGSKQKRLTELVTEETESSRRLSTMTDSMSKIAGSAADVLQELATKATAVQEAIKALEVKRQEFNEFERLQIEAENRRKEAEQRAKEADSAKGEKDAPKGNESTAGGDKGGTEQ